MIGQTLAHYEIQEHLGAGGMGEVYRELVRGPDLSELLADGGLDPEQLLDLAIPLAEAVGAAHRNGIVHRDLKPNKARTSPSSRSNPCGTPCGTRPSSSR